VPAKGPSARVRARAVRQVTCASWKTAVTEAVTAVPIWYEGPATLLTWPDGMTYLIGVPVARARNQLAPSG